MSEEARFLAIKNWHRYQGGKMKSGNERRPWVKDYVDKEADPEYGRLTAIMRYTLDACCRLRGRIGKNLPNDPTWIGRALCVLPAERAHLAYAVNALTKRGFLLLTNQQHGFVEEIREEKIRGDEMLRGDDSVVVPAPGDETKAKPPVAENPVSIDSQNVSSDLTVHQLARGMMDQLGIPGTHSDLNVFSQAITLKARGSGSTLPAAYEYILAKALDAKDRGEFMKPIFWMRDASYDHQPKRSKSDAATSDYRDRISREADVLRNHSRTASA